MVAPTNLPSAFVDNTSLPASSLNALLGGFRILQVVQGTTSTIVTNSTTTYADTGLSATITPRATSSKILVVISHNSCGKTNQTGSNGLTMILLRGASSIKNICDALGYTNTALDSIFSANAVVFDSPNTISATTYKTQFRNFQAGASVSVQTQSIESSITLLEVSL